jgi:hypothetical protein
MTSTTTRLASLADYRSRSGPPPDVIALHAFFAAAADADTPAAELHLLVASALARADRVTEANRHEWRRFLGLLDRHRENPKVNFNCAVLANLFGIAAFGDAADFVALAGLSDRLGVDRVAAVQHRTARFIEPDPTFPLTTVAVRRMVAVSLHTVAGSSLDSAVALLIEGVDPNHSLPVIRTSAELIGVVDGGSVLEWRHHLAMIAASPWSPYSRHLLELAEQAACPQVVAVVGRFTEVCREQNKAREREQVAEEVRRLVSASGVTQRQFAQWVGTSPSRLSTYVTGSVTPSASLMLRMARTSRLLQERDLHQALSTAMSEQSWGAARTAVDSGGVEGATGPSECASGALARNRSHLSAV